MSTHLPTIWPTKQSPARSGLSATWLSTPSAIIWIQLWRLCARRPPKRSSADYQFWARRSTTQRPACIRRRLRMWRRWRTSLASRTRRIRIPSSWSRSSRRSRTAQERLTAMQRRPQQQRLPEKKASFRPFAPITLTILFSAINMHSQNITFPVMTNTLTLRHNDTNNLMKAFKSLLIEHRDIRFI